MGKSLRMRVVAEGVESGSQAVALEGLHCDELQGYLLGRPMAAGAIAGLLEDGRDTAPGATNRGPATVPTGGGEQSGPRLAYPSPEG
jgi:diguanylate cyclase